MSKATATGFKAHIALESTTVATCWKVVRADGTTLGFTDHDVNIVYDGVTYKANTGITDSAAAYKDDGSIGSNEVTGAFGLNSTDIKETDLRAGLFDHAQVWVFQINWANTGQGIQKLFYGHIGEVRMGRNGFVSEVRDITHLLHQTIGAVTSPKCRYTLGDTNCGVTLLPDAWAATTSYAAATNSYDDGDMVRPSVYSGFDHEATVGGVSGGSEPTWSTSTGGTTTDNTVTWTARVALTHQGSVVGTPATRHQFTATGIGAADDWYNEGLLTWTGGANSGLKMEVKDWVNSTSVVTLILPMPYNLASGDTFTVTAGCNHLRDLSAYKDALGDCVAKFSNGHNFGAEPDLPGADSVLEFD